MPPASDKQPQPVPAIEALAPGLEAVVLPSERSPWLSAEGMPVRAYVIECGPAAEQAAGPGAGAGRGAGAGACPAAAAGAGAGTRPAGGQQRPPARPAVVLIDSGYATRLSVEAISSAIAGRPLAAILLTHRHPDHGGGARALAARHGSPVYAAPAAPPPLGADPELRFRPLAGGERLVFGGLELVSVPSPGHAPDHLAYHVPARGWLFTGDAVLGEGTVVVGPPDGSLADYLDTIERLAALEPVSAIFGGHGPPVTAPRARLEAIRRHRLMRLEQIRRALAAAPEGLSAAELVQRLYAGEVPAHLLALAQVSVLGSLRYLQERGEVSAEGERYRLER
ncbi:MAG: hypothetical protein KatS3mg102_0630 [Planctomycetota bacterium]|nr:MAG: hypothetical protein KatS3mg102_0630 [Planctomycetota bacterium]